MCEKYLTKEKKEWILVDGSGWDDRFYDDEGFIFLY